MATSPAEIYGSLIRQRPRLLSQIDALLLRAVATGESAVTTAKKVAQYLSPWYATRRKPTGGLVRDDRQGLVRSWPGEAGMASAHARMVMMTETARQHGQAVLKAAREQGRGVQWRLGSYRGKTISDGCDDNASGGRNGDGVYESGEVPSYPGHRNCRCWLQSVSLRGR